MASQLRYYPNVIILAEQTAVKNFDFSSKTLKLKTIERSSGAFHSNIIV